MIGISTIWETSDSVELERSCNEDESVGTSYGLQTLSDVIADECERMRQEGYDLKHAFIANKKLVFFWEQE